MSNSFKTFGAVTALAGLTTVFAATVVPQQASAKYTYSSKLVRQYNDGCRQKLEAKGHSTQKAQAACQCSINKMQSEMSQSQAIIFLTTAQFSSVDSSTGLPKKLSQYFNRCFV